MGIVIARIALHRVAGARQRFRVVAELAAELLGFEPDLRGFGALQGAGLELRLLGTAPSQGTQLFRRTAFPASYVQETQVPQVGLELADDEVDQDRQVFLGRVGHQVAHQLLLLPAAGAKGQL